MINKLVVFNSFAESYKYLANELVNNPEYQTSPRGLKINEILNQTIIINNPYSNLFSNEIREPSLRYLKEELKLYFSGNNKVKDFEAASKFWGKISDDGITTNSAYGHLLFVKKNKLTCITQWEWAKRSLIKDKYTRQAIMHLNRPGHQKDTLDFPCTMYLNFHIRNNKLNLIVRMRSNDILFGVFYDYSFFMLLMQCMKLELNKVYPELELGSYTHSADSLHLYEKDFEVIKSALNYQFKEVRIPRISVNPILNLDNEEFKNSEFKNSEFGKWLISE